MAGPLSGSCPMTFYPQSSALPLSARASAGLTTLSLSSAFTYTPSGAGAPVTFAAGSTPLVVFGGTASAGAAADSWISSNSGSTWTLLSSSATAYTSYPNSSACSGGAANQTLYVFGGVSGSSYVSAISSSPNGVTWRQLAAPAWPGRSESACVVDSTGRIIIIGGRVAAGNTSNDVWSSTDGVSWIRQTAAAPFTARAGHTATTHRSSALGVDLVFVASGYSSATANSPLNDIWVSSNSGASWSLVSNTPILVKRQYASMVALSSGVLVLGTGAVPVTSGTNPYYPSFYPVVNGELFDLWASLDGGYTWSVDRTHHEEADRSALIVSGAHISPLPLCVVLC